MRGGKHDEMCIKKPCREKASSVCEVQKKRYMSNMEKEEQLGAVVLGKFGLVWFRAIFARPETRPSGL